MARFFSDHIDDVRSMASIDDPSEIHHLRDVLRLSKRHRIEVINGKGIVCDALIAEIGRSAVLAEIVSRRVFEPSTTGRITLACALPKKAKFETIIEKSTEAGVDEIIPMVTDRTEVTPDCIHRKNDRLSRVAVNAGKQSRRVFFPVLHPVASFGEVLMLMRPGTRSLIPWLEGERIPLRKAVENCGALENYLVLIGPEGDFTPEEVRRAVGGGAVPVSLGETVLKVDTAALAVVSFIRQFHA